MVCDVAGALIAFNVATGKELWRTPVVPAAESRFVALFRRGRILRFSADGAVVNARVITASVGFRGISGTAFRRQVDVSTGRLLVDEKEGESASSMGAVSHRSALHVQR